MKNNHKVLKHIAVLTSEGDAPGMNAAIRAVTRTAINNQLKVTGVMEGYKGLIQGDFIELFSQSVSGIIQRGGTMLRSARCLEFMHADGLEMAIKKMREASIDALVVIGGDGTFRGAVDLMKMYNFPVIGIPGTIDNDICGTDYTIGFDTCLNTVVESIDKIRDTGSSHNRVFFVEVMGHKSGFVALNSGVACGAEIILVPEQKNHLEKTRNFLANHAHLHKLNLIVVSEGLEEGNAMQIARQMKVEFPHFDMRVSVLGYIQRGGSPSAYDRLIAGEFGVAAVNALLSKKYGMMVGLQKNKIVLEPLTNVFTMHKCIDESFVQTAESIGTYTPLGG